MRCAALAEAPYAYSSTLENALERSAEDWKQITHQYASHSNSVTYFAFEDEEQSVPLQLDAPFIAAAQV